MIIFDGKTFAEEQERVLASQVAELRRRGIKPKLVAILFAEDAGSVLYTRLKKEAAEQIGIEYQVITFSMKVATEEVMATIKRLSEDQTITGIIIQKPWRKRWQSATMVEGSAKDIRQAFNSWWTLLTSQIAIEKDVDGLHPQTLAAIESGSWQQKGRVMPATAAAVFSILKQAALKLDGVEEAHFWDWIHEKKVAVIGKSDIVGKPIYFELKNKDVSVEMMGSSQLKRRVEQGKYLHDFDVVISATGRKHLVSSELLRDSGRMILIDVGEPQPDIDFDSVKNKAAFITPVPGGVGPMTVSHLLENAVYLNTVDRY